MDQLLTEWEKITGVRGEILDKYKDVSDDLMQPEDMSKWLIRECDREDRNDWMPCRVRVCTDRISVWYLNVRVSSSAHEHTLVLTMRHGIKPVFYEWHNGVLCSTRIAVVEDKPKTGITDDDRVHIASYVAINGGYKADPMTINGKSVNM